ncbi:hypothetical protein BDN70DRAFT_315821 [Pholiota conissans]|uniref:Uncharacterized protein n=1 Tax=Pholiota conissans TaxID=109636 RepID=A0A9P5ZAM8_9AGAR|nr:hypothetical protein BDN70DRAFT_315821 [Pholiota conissans]
MSSVEQNSRPRHPTAPSQDSRLFCTSGLSSRSPAAPLVARQILSLKVNLERVSPNLYVFICSLLLLPLTSTFFFSHRRVFCRFSSNMHMFQPFHFF